MSKKNLLNESQVRQFMKLANLQPLSPGFVRGLTKSTSQKNESNGRGKKEGAAGYGSPDQNSRNEALEDDLDATEDELGAEDEFADEEGDEIDDLEGELDVADDEMGAEEGGRMVSVDDFLEALESALETAMGDEVEVDASEMSDELEDEEDLAADDDFAPEGEDVVADDELEDEMLEGFTGPSVNDDDRVAWEKTLKPAEDDESDPDRESAGDRMRARRNRRSTPTAGSRNAFSLEEGNTDALVEQITKRVAARIIKSALAKK